MVKILKKLNKADMTISKDKCELNCIIIFRISKDEISSDEILTKKISEMFPPRNKKGTEILFGTNKSGEYGGYGKVALPNEVIVFLVLMLVCS